MSIANWPTAEIALPKGSTTPSKAPFPVIAPPLAPKPIHIPAPGVVKIETGEPDKPEQSPAFKLGVTIALVATGLIVCVGGFFGWKHFASGKSSPSKNPPTVPAAVAPKPASKPVENAKSALTPGHDSVPPAGTSLTPAPKPDLAKRDESPVKLDRDQPAAINPNDGKSTPSSSPSSVPTTVAPGVTANMGVPVSNVGASPEFRAWVANVKISGVFQGPNSRALINGRMTRVGDPVDARLGIVFEGIDSDRKQIIFKDASGATATRKY